MSEEKVVSVRLKPDHHRRLRLLAAELDVSMGRIITDVLEHAELVMLTRRLDRLIEKDDGWGDAPSRAMQLIARYDAWLGECRDFVHEHGEYLGIRLPRPGSECDD